MLKFLHVGAAVLLLGNVTVTGVWALVIYRSGGRSRFGPAIRAILLTDVLFTGLGGALLTITGILLILRHGYNVLATPWLWHGIAALGLSTAIWLAVLLPGQLRMKQADADGDTARLHRIFVRWNLVGWAATLLLFYGLAAMVMHI